MSAPEPLAEADAAGTRSRRPGAALLVALLVALVVAAVHRPALEARALWLDDEQFLTANEHVLDPSWGGAARVLTEVGGASPVAGYYTPLSVLSLMADAARGGSPADLRPFHATSLALHAANAALVALLVQALFGRLAVAALIGLVFGLHPTAVEPVAWIAGRKTVLSASFALLAVLGHVARARRGSRIGGLVSAPAFALSLLAHPASAPLPLLLVVLDLWPLRRGLVLRDKLPHLALAAAGAAVTLLSHAGSADVEAPAGALAALAAGAQRLVFYARQLAWPVELAPVYVLPPPDGARGAWSVAAVLASFAAAALLARRTRAPLAALSWFALALLPTLGLVRYSWVEVADKYLYLAALGPLLAVAALLVRAWGSVSSSGGGARAAALAAALVLLALEARGARSYLAVWRDSEALRLHALAAAPDSAAAHALHATWLTAEGRPEEAFTHHRRAAELAPGSALARYNLANALRARGDHEAALAAYGAALALDPGHVGARFNRGRLLSALGRPAEAEADLAAVLVRRPDLAEAHNELGNCRFARGDLAGAAASYARALELEPGLVAAHRNLGSLRLAQGDGAAAALRFGDAVGLRPDDADLRYHLALALFLAGRAEQAERQLERAVELDSAHGDARRALDALRAERP